MAGNINLKRLKYAVDMSFSKLSTFRKHRYSFIQQYVGYHYSKKGSRERVPVNMMAQAVIIYVKKLISNNPQVLVTNFNQSLKSQCTNLGLACNEVIKQIDYKRTLQLVVLDALFGFGIVKKGLSLKSQVEFNGFLHDIGQMYIDQVSIDDFVFDMSAKRWDQCYYMGNKYSVPFDYAIESGMYNEEILINAHRKQNDEYRKGFQTGGDPEAAGISREGGHPNDEEAIDYLDLIDLWLPYEGKFLTFPYEVNQGDWKEPAREMDFAGPETGPYGILSFHDVPDQILPLPPASLWMDLQELGNKLFRKLSRQAERSKTILAVAKGAGKDGEKIVDAEDGEAIGVSHPDKCQEYHFGGVDNVGLAFYLQVKNLFSYYAGNLDSLGGLGAMTDTVGQDKLINEGSNETVNLMSERCYDFTKKDVNDIAWYLWYDPMVEIPFVKPISGTGVNIPYVFTEDDKDGSFLNYNFSVVPYSMQEDSPSTKLQKMGAIFQQFVAPMMPIMQQQGVMLNVQEFFSIISKYSNLPEFENALIFAEGNPNQSAQPIGNPGSKFSHTVNERVNRPGATVPGQDQAMMTALLSGMDSGQQVSQGASTMRSVA